MIDLYNPIVSTLSAAKRVLITTHVRPDGDALGSAAAMAMALRYKKIDSEILLLSHLPRKYAFIFKDNNLSYHDVEAGWPQSYPMQQYDALLVVDTGTWSQLPGLREHLDGWKKPRLVVDHHLTQEDWADAKYVKTDAAAAGEIAAELLTDWGVKFTVPIATEWSPPSTSGTDPRPIAPSTMAAS